MHGNMNIKYHDRYYKYIFQRCVKIIFHNYNDCSPLLVGRQEQYLGSLAYSSYSVLQTDRQTDRYFIVTKIITSQLLTSCGKSLPVNALIHQHFHS